MVAEAKKILRRNILTIRNSLTPEDISERSRKIGETLFREKHFKKAKTVAFYIPKGNEVQTRDMMEHAIREGKEILVPVTDSEVSMCEFTSFFDMVPGKFGVPEPKHHVAKDHAAEVVLVPGIVFGPCMHRIGYGKGYYDKYFKKNPKVFKIGMCYDFQVMDELPKHGHDIPMDLIITDKRLIKPSK
jgi:5-formyltetrahydrofolate cyclo-ligase